MPTIEKLKREYDAHAEKFRDAGFPWELVEATGEKAMLNIWDMFVIFLEVRRNITSGTYLEIGSHLGGSLVCAWETCSRGHPRAVDVRFISIDPFVAGRKYAEAREKAFRANTAHINNEHYAEYSHLVAHMIDDDSIDVLFVDGDHTYPAVKRDFLLYWPKVRSGGVLLAHDFSYGEEHEGVVRAVMDTFVFQEIEKPFRSNIAVIRKRADNKGLFVYGPRYGIGG